MSNEMIELLIKSFWETSYMVVASTLLASLIGIPLGIILTVTRANHILPNAAVNSVLGVIVNATRSTPFIILMVAIIPLTRMLVGSSIGTTAAIVPLTISAAPFIARVIESSLLEIDHGVIEAAQSMGASPLQIIYKVLLPEALHSIVLGSFRRRRPWRLSHPLRLSALPAGCYDCYRCYFDCHGADYSVPWRYAQQKAEQK